MEPGAFALGGWDTYSSLNQRDRTTAPLARQGMTPPKHLSRALYIPRHDGGTAQLTVYDISAQYTTATSGLSIGSSEYEVALGLMQKPVSGGSNGASAVYDVMFKKEGEDIVASVRFQGATVEESAEPLAEQPAEHQAEQQAEQPAKVELAIASAKDTAGFLTSKESTSTGSAATETTRVSISYPVVPSQTGSASHQAPLPYFRVTVGSSIWEWQTQQHHHGRLRYTLVRLPAQDQSADAGREEILAIYNHVGMEASVTLPYSEGVLLLPSPADPRTETMVVASLLTMLWRLRDLSGEAGGKQGGKVTESMKRRFGSLRGLLGRKA